MEEDILLTILELPQNIKAVTIPLKNNNYHIFLNSFYENKEQKEILEEEIGKIQKIPDKRI